MPAPALLEADATRTRTRNGLSQDRTDPSHVQASLGLTGFHLGNKCWPPASQPHVKDSEVLLTRAYLANKAWVLFSSYIPYVELLRGGYFFSICIKIRDRKSQNAHVTHLLLDHPLDRMNAVSRVVGGGRVNRKDCELGCVVGGCLFRHAERDAGRNELQMTANLFFTQQRTIMRTLCFQFQIELQ